MDCERARELILTDDLDGEASPANKRDLLQHLVGCEPCRMLKEQAGPALVVPFTGLASPPPPTAVWEALAARLEAEAAPTAPTGREGSPTATFADLVAGIIRGWRGALAGGLALAALILLLAHPWSLPPAPSFAPDSPAAQVFLLIEDDTAGPLADPALIGKPSLGSAYEEVFF